MNTENYKKAVESALAAGNYHEAFRLLKVLMPADAVALRSLLETATDDYKRIVDFAMTGSPDPDRKTQLSQLTTRIYSILDMLIREKLISDQSALYYNVLRTLRLRKTENLQSLLREYSAALGSSSAFTIGKANAGSTAERRRELESLEERIFDRVWTTTPMSFDEMAGIRALMTDDATPATMKALIVGALTMSLLQFFNEPLLRLLLEFADERFGQETQLRATVGAVIVMSRWPRRSDSKAVADRIAALREGAHWSTDVEQTIMQIIRMADVEKIARTMRDEIIPEMMKLRPDFEKHIKESGFDIADAEMNPEWDELLEKSGLSERLRKFSEMQFAGGDIFYSAFSMLKTYPFFSHISHWFMPFDPDRSDVAAAVGHDVAFAMMLAETTAMCSSDKYSFAFSIDRLPETQKQMVLSQMSEANIRLAEMAGSELMPEKSAREALIRSYVQDLYRFFALFRRCGEFENPFNRPVNPANIPALKNDFAEPEKIRLLGEFYFSHGHSDQALALFRMLPPDLTLHQKMGHALLKLGRNEEALREFERADLLAPESEWTLKKLASVSKALGRYEEALGYYERIERITPDKPENALQMGFCNIQLNRIREALHCCYKAEMLDEKSTRPLRPIAWCAFLSGDIETSRRYFERIFREMTPTSADYLNMGHLELASGNMREAINYYKLHSSDTDTLQRAIADDMPILERAGIDTSALPLLLDAIRFSND